MQYKYIPRCAMAGYSEDPVARASTQQLFVYPHMGGQLWEVSRAATDAELPSVIRHFAANRSPACGASVSLRVVPPRQDSAAPRHPQVDAADDDADIEVRDTRMRCTVSVC